MTINTQKLREAAANAKDLAAEDLSGFPLTATAHIEGLARVIESCCDHIDAQATKIAEAESQTDRYRRASERWKKVAESAEERARDQAAEIAEAKGQIEYLDRQNNALREAQAWQTIETAPKDGTAILLATPGGRVADGCFHARYGVWSWPYVMVNPTHWMPLPAAPDLQENSHD